MGESKLYTVKLVKGYSFTSGGRTYYQNRPLRLSLTDEEVERFRTMDGGTKFHVAEVTTPPKAAPAPPVVTEPPAPPAPPAPPVEDDGDEPEDDGDEPEDDGDIFDDPDFDEMTVPKLKKYLDDHGVSYPSGARRDDLIELCKSL